MPAASPPLPWPLVPAAMVLVAFSMPFGAADGLGGHAVASAITLLLLGFLSQIRAREWAGGRWAADASTCALLLGSPLLLHAVAASPLPLGSLLVFGGFLLAAPGKDRGRGARLLLAGLLWSAAVIVVPALLPAAFALFLWAIALPSSSGGTLFGGGARPAARRLVALSPFLLLSGLYVLQEAGLLAQVPRPAELSSLLWPVSCECKAAGSKVPAASALLPLAAPLVLLALPGTILALKRFDRRAEATGCLMVLLFQAAAAWGIMLGPGRSLLDEQVLAQALGFAAGAGGGARIGPAQIIAGLIVPVLPLLLVLASPALDWLRNRPAAAGPRMAGLALGPVCAAIALNALALNRALPEAAPSLARLLPLSAAVLAAVVMGLLLPGKASPRGRLTALGLAAVTTAVLVMALLAL